MDQFDMDDHLTLENAKSTFLRIMRTLSQKDKTQFLSYIEREWDVHEYCNVSSDSSPERENVDGEFDVPPIIKMIISDIKARIPFEAILPSENIQPPKKGENADCYPIATVHVDGFLYDDEEVDTLIDTGKLQTNYCADCGSKNVKPCVIISHSTSYKTMEYVFHQLLPVLKGKTVLDIGSRLGAVLYSAYVLSTAEEIVGIEMNADFCKLQSTMVDKYNMSNRIRILNERVENCPDVVHNSDVIFLNNVFEFYMSEAEHREIWQFLKANIKRGTLLVTRPRIEETFKYLKTGIVIDEWVKPYILQEQDNVSNTNNLECLDYPDIACYEVL